MHDAAASGTTAIQLAKAVGASVIVTAGSDEKCRRCEALGANIAINYKRYDFAQLLTQGHTGIDVLLDMVCGDYFDKNLRVMNYNGRCSSGSLQLATRVVMMRSPGMQGCHHRPEARLQGAS